MAEPVPRHLTIEQSLRARIALLEPHATLPSDAQLCEEFGVSRMTARGAVQRLVHEGLVYRVPGRGTFVAPARANRTASRILSFTDEMRRSGRTDVKIPILMPDAEARAQIFAVTVKKHKLQSAIADFKPFAERTDGFTGSDIELAVTTAYRFAAKGGAPAITDAHLLAALDDLIPHARDQKTIDRMTLLALEECRNKRLLPRNHEQIRKEIEARARN